MRAAPSESTWFRLETGPSSATLHLLGEWHTGRLAAIESALAASLATRRFEGTLDIDASELKRIDSAAALVLQRQLARISHSAPLSAWAGLDEAHLRVLRQVQARVSMPAATAAPPHPILAQLGRHTAELASLLFGHLAFMGAALAALGALVRHPSRLRLRELTVQLEQTGLNAIPVVILVTTLIGVVLAYLLGLQAEKYGANIFVVDGVGIGATREFAPIIVAVIVAGRSGAAFTAQLGSMRLTEEIDAIRTLGLDVWQVLVVPRMLALMLALPLLVFVGDVASLVGAMIVGGGMLDVTPPVFLARLREALDVRHVAVGLIKAPVFAFVIALIGTRMGMSAGRDTRAVGAATTSTVVQSIVAVILLDAAFAVLLQSLGW
jgi:phospholipid/cholesterol/gamma-HCH transport system permease protein